MWLSEKRGILSRKTEELFASRRKWNNEELLTCIIYKFYQSDEIKQKAVDGKGTAPVQNKKIIKTLIRKS
jgi:hypothetical protein